MAAIAPEATREIHRRWTRTDAAATPRRSPADDGRRAFLAAFYRRNKSFIVSELKKYIFIFNLISFFDKKIRQVSLFHLNWYQTSL